MAAHAHYEIFCHLEFLRIPKELWDIQADLDSRNVLCHLIEWVCRPLLRLRDDCPDHMEVYYKKRALPLYPECNSYHQSLVGHNKLSKSIIRAF